MRRLVKIALTGTALILGVAASSPPRWTPGWTASMWQGTNDKQSVTVENVTIAFTVRVGGSGDRLRIRLSNEYGAPLRIGAASVRLAGGETVPVTFDGQGAASIGAKSTIASDAATLKVKPFDVVEISLYLPERATLNTIHSASGSRTRISGPGDFTTTPFAPARTADSRPLLAAIELSGGTPRPVIVAFGDSITDNTGCKIDDVPICRWSDVLARRLAQAGKKHVVVTQAISGNRILSMGTGPAAVDRFDRDVLALPGVTHVVLLEGINDIGGSGRVRPDGTAAPTITAAQLIDGYRKLIARAHQRGIKVMALTILPFQGAGYYSDAGEAMRVAVNDWMRTSGEFDGVFDMEKVVADPANAKRLDPALHRGDGLHPNGVGETKMGEAIPLAWFR